jgi:hypothetical protein
MLFAAWMFVSVCVIVVGTVVVSATIYIWLRDACRLLRARLLRPYRHPRGRAKGRRRTLHVIATAPTSTRLNAFVADDPPDPKTIASN